MSHHDEDPTAEVTGPGTAIGFSDIKQVAPDSSSREPGQWAVRFMNTPSQQEFIIQAQ